MLSQRGKARPLEELAEPAEPDEQDAGEVEAEDPGEHGEAPGESEGSGEESQSGDERENHESDDGEVPEGEVDDHASQNGDGKASDGVLSQATLTLDDCHDAVDDGNEYENTGDPQSPVPSPTPGTISDVSDDEPEGPESCELVRTPEPKGWREELFTTPQFGNSGPRRSEIVEMGLALMEFFGHHHPHVSANFSWY